MSSSSSAHAIVWTQAGLSEVPLRRFTGQVGAVEVGIVEYDATNHLWTWWSPLAEDVWGHAPSADGAQQAVGIWLRGWLENFRPFFQANTR